MTVVNYCNLKENYFDYFIDTTKSKIGKYLPGTKIIVKKYDKSKLEKRAFYFLGAWNFKKEIFIKEKNFLKKGGKFILHLPTPHIYKKKKMKKNKILITGAAGFIGFALCKKLLNDKNNKVIGLDNLNSYYSVKLKKKELKNEI